MAKKRHTAEQIIRKLPWAGAALSKGEAFSKIAGKLGITEQAYCLCRKESGGLGTVPQVPTVPTTGMDPRSQAARPSRMGP